jgi:hypothetical protein
MATPSMEWAPSGFCRLQHFNFGQDAGCFFQAETCRHNRPGAARLKLKTQVAQVLIDRAFVEMNDAS